MIDRAYREAHEAWSAETEKLRSVVQAPGVLAALRGHLEIRDTDEFIAWLLAAAPTPQAPVAPVAIVAPPVAPVAPPTAMPFELIDQIADMVAAKLRPVYPPVAFAPAPAPQPVASTVVDTARLSPLQRAMVNAMLQGR